MFLKIKKKLFNDIHIGVCFLFLFTAFLTFSSIQQTLSVSIARDNPHYHADAYICAGILNGVFAFSSWLTPSLITLFGWKLTIVTGSLLYLPLVTGYYFETDWISYASAVAAGIGAALVWNSQATYIVLNSELQNTYKGITCFWIIYQFSAYGGNLFIFYLFEDSEEFAGQDVRGTIYIFLGALVVCSTILFSFLCHPIREKEAEKKKTDALLETKKAITIGLSKKILISNIVFLSMGLNVAFIGASAASLGFTRYLSDNPKKFAPLTGVFLGIGEMIGCILGFGMKDKPMCISKLRLAPIGNILIMAAFTIIFIGLPNSSAISFTDEEPFIELPLVCFLLAEIFIGMADACSHIEAYSFLGQLYPSDSPPVFAVFKFTRGIGICIGYYLSRFVGLHAQTIILFICTFLSTIVNFCCWQSPKPVTIN